MNRMGRVALGGALVGLATTAGLGIVGTSAQSGDIRAVMRVESAGQPAMEMDYYLGENRMRMDMSEAVSLISISGDSPTMYMVQHPQQRYIEWGAQQLQMMQQMMQQMPGVTDQANDMFDTTQLVFQQTGATDQIGPWNAFEVEMTDPDGERGSLWLTTDTDTGLFEVMVRVADAASIMSSPMGGGMSLDFLQFQTVAQAQGLPAGRVVRIVYDDDNGATTITLTEVDPGPLPNDTFEPPAGYTQMQMPSIPGFPG